MVPGTLYHSHCNQEYNWCVGFLSILAILPFIPSFYPITFGQHWILESDIGEVGGEEAATFFTWKPSLLFFKNREYLSPFKITNQF
jgi:hypothetical protein